MRDHLPGIVLSIAMALSPTGASFADDAPAFAVLVFSKTAGYRHDSIPAGIDAIRALGAQHGFTVDATEDENAFTDANLARYREVVFLSTTGEVLGADGRAAFERFIHDGGGFAGIHAASDSGYEWPWYGGLVGAYFQRHPAIQPAILQVVDASYPSTRGLPVRWKRIDEWYDFRAEPDPAITVLLRIDEASYAGGRMGARHPMAWQHDYDGGRAWYTALGHTIASYSEPLFLEHLRGGILWAAGAAKQ